MLDVSSIAAGTANAAATLKMLLEAVKAARGLAHGADINAAIIDIQQKLIDHQTAYLELVEKHQAVTMERDALKKELLDLKQSKANFNRYELKILAPGFSAYVLKESAANGDQPHWLCPKCHAKGMIGIIQLSPTDGFASTFPGEQNIAHLVCASCEAEFSMPRDAFNVSWGKFA